MQQALVVGGLLVVAAWIAGWWSRSPVLALAGAFVLVFGYSGALAFEFVLLKTVGRDPEAPEPTAWQVLRAWWVETCTTPVVFWWRQPFRWRAEPDALQPAPGRRGVVLVHGFVCNRGLWNPWLRELRALGVPVVAVNLEPVFGPIDAYVPIIDDAVRRVAAASGGLAPVVVGHSMGGLAARAWLRATAGGSRVHHLVTIGTPHRGTWLGRFSRTHNGRQMRLGDAWTQQLGELPPDAKVTCWYSNCDNVVFPVSSATLPAADNRFLPGVPHVALAYRSEVRDDVRRLVGVRG